MEISRSNNYRLTGVKRSYWLANTAVTHIASHKTSAKLFLASHSVDPKLPATDSLFELLITVDHNHIASLRHVASEACGEQMDSFHIQPTRKPDCQLVRLRCFGKATIIRLMDAVMARLDSAEFGRVCRVQSRR